MKIKGLIFSFYNNYIIISIHNQIMEKIKQFTGENP